MRPHAEQSTQHAGFGWQAGWYAELLLELVSLSRSTGSMWGAISCLLVALAGFAWTLGRLYRCTHRDGTAR